jgi:hypothetical protein
MKPRSRKPRIKFDRFFLDDNYCRNTSDVGECRYLSMREGQRACTYMMDILPIDRHCPFPIRHPKCPFGTVRVMVLTVPVGDLL